MTNSAFVKDVSKALKQQSVSSELSPGSVGRRYEPECGVRKHNERIHKESKFADDNKNLPFSFSKPKKSGRTSFVECDNCGHVTAASINTVGKICSNCKKFSTVTHLE